MDVAVSSQGTRFSLNPFPDYFTLILRGSFFWASDGLGRQQDAGALIIPSPTSSVSPPRSLASSGRSLGTRRARSSDLPRGTVNTSLAPES